MGVVSRKLITLQQANKFESYSEQSKAFVEGSSAEKLNTLLLQLDQKLEHLVQNFEMRSSTSRSPNGARKTTRQVACDPNIIDELEKLAYESISSKVAINSKLNSEYIKAIVRPLIHIFEGTPNPDEVEGLISQLRTRQNELNQEVKKATESIEQRVLVNLNRLDRELNKSLQELDISSEKSKSDSLQQIKTLSSNVQIGIEEFATTQKNEIAKEISQRLELSIEKKKDFVFKQLEFDCSKLLKEVKTEVNTLSGRVSNQIDEFCTLNESLRKTLAYVASDALADATIKQAKEEKQSADNLRAMGLAWLFFTIVIIISTFNYDSFLDPNGDPRYSFMVLRSFFLLAVSAPGFYLLRESARHRTDERRYRQKGIQLATIDGYLAEFDGADRNTVKKELTKHYFHGGDHFVDSSSVDKIQTGYDKVFDKVLAQDKSKNK